MNSPQPPATMPFRENLTGIGAITACNFFFLINDTCLKLASAELPKHIHLKRSAGSSRDG